MKYIAVLLTVFNRKDKTIQCLTNLYKQALFSDFQLEIFLTNDGCTDGTPEAVKEQFPNVHIINGNGSLFWNRGMWTAWDAASHKREYDYYLWLNDDTFIFEHTLNKLIQSAEFHKNQSIIVGATVDSETQKKITYGGWKKDTLISCNGSDEEIDYFNGNIVLIPKFAYDILGNLDYTFTHSKGDFDYGLRAKENNIKMFLLGEPLGICDLHSSIDSWCNPNIPLRKRIALLNRPNGMPPKETFYFEKKHYGFFLASFHFCTIHLRCIFPRLWIFMGKQ